MRYNNKETNILDNKNSFVKKRNRLYIEHNKIPKFRKLSEQEESLISSNVYIWQVGDKLYKLSQKYYGNIEDWWLIALYNNKPTEYHFKEGDEVLIPFPKHILKQLYGV